MDAILRVERLTKRFGGVVALDGADFAVRRGSITGLIGPNGAGKTTAFNIIAGALSSNSGRVIYDGVDITGLPTHKLFHMGVVRSFQIPKEYAHITAIENLMVAPSRQRGENILKACFARFLVQRQEREIIRRAEEVLEFLGLSSVRDELAGNLSGGQKKLLELGRAMMIESRLVLLDEPGAGVNPTLMGRIADMIVRLNRERNYSFCIIEHDMDLITRLCDPVIVLADGRVLTEGPMELVRADPEVIDAYFGA